MKATTGLKARDGLAFSASLGSVMLGYLLMGHFVMATLTWTGSLGPKPSGTWYTTVYHITRSKWMLLLVGWAALVVVLGIAGLTLAGRDRARRNPAGLTAFAARFAIGGLIAGGVDVVLVVGLLYLGWFWV
jgi:hypothetical protein